VAFEKHRIRLRIAAGEWYVLDSASSFPFLENKWGGEIRPLSHQSCFWKKQVEKNK
jgi:hypothetical protein